MKGEIYFLVKRMVLYLILPMIVLFTIGAQFDSIMFTLFGSSETKATIIKYSVKTKSKRVFHYRYYVNEVKYDKSTTYQKGEEYSIGSTILVKYCEQFPYFSTVEIE